MLLVLRTRRPFWKSRPHTALLGSTLAVAALIFALPLSPLRAVLGFVELPEVIWLSVVGIAVSYVLTIEAVKRPLFSYLDRRAEQPGRHGGHPPSSHRLWPR